MTQRAQHGLNRREFLKHTSRGAMAGGPRSGDEAGTKRGLVNGMMSILIEPGRLIDGGWFDQALAQLTDYVKASPAADETLPVLVPGEPERDSRAHRGREGIPIDPTTWKQIVGCARAFELAIPDFPVARA